MSNLENIRKLFPALKQKIHGFDLVYLDSAATALKPQSVIDALTKHYSLQSANVHRGIHLLSSEATRLYEETRTSVKNFINASEEAEIIFTKGTTESINLVAASWGEKFLSEGDVILISEMEHHSNIVPWQLSAEKNGAAIKVIPVDDKGDLILEDYKQMLETFNVKMVAVNQASNTLGTVNPVKEMIKLAHQHGAKFLVDAAQSAAHMKIDVKDLDCDFLAFSAHKLYGPTGFGILYGKKELLEEMPPYQGGGAMIKEVTFEKTTFNDLPEKFEAGTPHIAGAIAFKSALEFMDTLGANIQAEENQLLAQATEELKKIKGIRIIGEANEKISVLSFVLDGAHPHDLGMILDQQGVAIRTGHHCTQPLMVRYGIPATARASFAPYNNHDDVERLVSAVKKAKELL